MTPTNRAGVRLLTAYDRMRAAQKRAAQSRRTDDLMTARAAEAEADAAAEAYRAALFTTPALVEEGGAR